MLTKRINWEEVAASIRGAPPTTLHEFDFQTAKAMVWALVENFAARDATEFVVDGVERRVEIDRGPGRVLKAVIDVTGVINSTLKTFAPYNGKRYVVDWKTSRNKLSSEWRSRLVDSWQWRIYAYIEQAALVIYRGVNREEETNELIIEVPSTNNEEVEEYLEGGFAQREALVTQRLPVWPRIKKYSTCEAFGYECPYYDDCRAYTMPRQALDLRPMSYTQFENFFLCPERSRRGLLENAEETTDSSSLGKGVHRGMEHIYKKFLLQAPAPNPPPDSRDASDGG